MDEILRDKAFNIGKITKYDGYQRGLASVVYKFFDKNYSGTAVTRVQLETLATLDKSVRGEIVSGQKLTEKITQANY